MKAFLYFIGLCVFNCHSASVTFGKYQQTGNICSPSHRCIPIVDCFKYQSDRAIRRDRPRPCGFSDTIPLVCCPHLVNTAGPKNSESGYTEPPYPTSEPPYPTLEPSLNSTVRSDLEALLQLLPDDCGDPDRTVFNLPLPTLPPTPPPKRRPGEVRIAAGIGGRPAEEGKWPWMVLLGRWSQEGQLGDWFCGGTLITDRHVLTAAHCLHPEQLDTVGARLGEHDLSTSFDVIHQDRNISRITRHERYRGAQNDIALLELEVPAVPSEYVRPICLPSAGAEHRGRTVEMAGFGQLEFAGEVPDVLQEVPLRVLDELACERNYSREPQFQLKFPGGFQGTKVCAGSIDEEPRDACPGDSGGPLMARRPSGNLYELVGVVSTGVGCGNPEFPGIYTKVSAYIEWILLNILANESVANSADDMVL